ncbi:polysaccharide pyruvyl transferase family protein [Vibrio coralliirubri]|uniref:polysaccharide pyruvyl transferase family protein n=1 Tax=Vibrio coralliirubri TaxID=1516159 RepID=UPI00069B1E9D|nr:polysaccharide pyruvyl transferase family protein [Vibrio coralliirubri]
MKVFIQQAYSRKNSGDGLLVDLTLKNLQEAFGDHEYTILANDPASFSDLKNVYQGQSTRIGISKYFHSAINIGKLILNLVFKVPVRDPYLEKLSSESDLIVGVGGGYMRGKGALETLKCLANNIYQLAWAKDTGKPIVYFPQSVGAYHPLIWRMISRYFKDMTYYCRDDRSSHLVDGSIRMPDLVVLEIANKLNIKPINPKRRDGILFVVRELNDTEARISKYKDNINKLSELYDSRCEFVIQSKGRGNDDEKFASEVLGLTGLRTLKEALRDGKNYLVVSVRLHGALESILSGHTAIHLSYERKGFGAYSDIGIIDYCHNVFDFDLDELNNQIENLLLDETYYWNQVNKSADLVLKSRDTMIKGLNKHDK